MPFLFWLFQFLLTVVAFFVTPVLMLLALPFANNAGPNTLPLWLQFLQTPDDVGPNQGMYETAVAWVNNHLGWHVKTWYWLGIRNQMYGLFWLIAPKTAIGDVVTGSTPYPNIAPFQAGAGLYKIKVSGHTYIEFKAVWSVTASKCMAFGVGYKVHTLEGTVAPQPVSFLFQPKFWPLSKG